MSQNEKHKSAGTLAIESFFQNNTEYAKLCPLMTQVKATKSLPDLRQFKSQSDSFYDGVKTFFGPFKKILEKKHSQPAIQPNAKKY